VADNCKEMHMVLNGTFRAIEDNEKLSVNVILAMKERYLLNVPNDIMPGLKLLLKEECDDARKAIQSVVIPSVTGPLMQLLGLVQKFLDDDSMVPRIAARSTIAGTPVKSWRITRAGRNGTSFDPGFFAFQRASASTSSSVVMRPSQFRRAASRRILILNGSLEIEGTPAFSSLSSWNTVALSPRPAGNAPLVPKGFRVDSVIVFGSSPDPNC